MGKPVFRQNVSIPADLKRRMDKVGDQINWSAIACAAFEVKLGEIAASKEKKNMNDVIQRLRGLRAASNDGEYVHGKGVGAAWAKDVALPEQLELLDEVLGNFLLFEGVHDADEAFSPIEHFAFAFLGPDSRSRQSAREFWGNLDAITDEKKMNSQAFFRGFIDGAREIWDAVKDEI